MKALIKESIQKKTGKTYRVIFKGSSTNVPLISDTAKNFSVDLNVFHGMVTELQGIPFGNLLINIEGESEEIDRAIQFMRDKDAIVKEVTQDAL